jgi:hypothetical protein
MLVNNVLANILEIDHGHALAVQFPSTFPLLANKLLFIETAGQQHPRVVHIDKFDKTYEFRTDELGNDWLNTAMKIVYSHGGPEQHTILVSGETIISGDPTGEKMWLYIVPEEVTFRQN